MKKIKVLVAVALVSTLIGVTSFAQGTVQKAKSPEIYDVLNNNADILSDHIDNIASTDLLGHIKIGSGLQTAEDGTTSVKIANDLTTDDSETALSAAMGKQLNSRLNNNVSYCVDFGSNGRIWYDEITKTLNVNCYIDGSINNGAKIGHIDLPHSITSEFSLWFYASVGEYGMIPCNLTFKTNGDIYLYASQNANINKPVIDASLYIGDKISE